MTDMPAAGVARAAALGACGAVLLQAALCSPASASGQAEFERDLRVMEDVLVSLCRHSRPEGCGPECAPVARGTHVDGYGVVFVLEGCPDGPTAQAQARALAGEFLGRFAPAIGQLGPEERVAVTVYPPSGSAPVPEGAPAGPPPGSYLWPGLDLSRLDGGRAELNAELAMALWRLLRAPVPGDSLAGGAPAAQAAPETASAAAQPEPPVLAASVWRRDLELHQRGRLTTDELAARVHLESQDPASPELRSLDIMAAILARGLGVPPCLERRAVLGARHAGLGALFLVDLERLPPLPGPGEPGRGAGPAPPRPWPVPADRIEAALRALLLAYAPTVQGLHADESVVVEVRVGPAPARSGAAGCARLVARVPARALAAPARGAMDGAALGEAIRVSRF